MLTSRGLLGLNFGPLFGNLLTSSLHLGHEAFACEMILAFASHFNHKESQSNRDIEENAQADAGYQEPAQRLAFVQAHPICEAKQRVCCHKDC